MAAIRLVVGLGNPGAKYAHTRHNLGFRVLDQLIQDSGDWKKWKDTGSYGETTLAGGKVFCVRPLTYMNLSGKMVAEFSQFYKVPPHEILVCYDDFALNLGQLRIRPRGSAGGHNGMKSIIECLGTQEIPRLRIGVGPLPPGSDPAHFVLEKVDSKTEKEIASAVSNSVDAVKAVASGGIEAAMNRFNAAPKADA